jgi:hypothetical protein
VYDNDVVNHALQRTRPSRSGCNPRLPRAGSLCRQHRARAVVVNKKAYRRIMKTLSVRTCISKKAIHLAALFLLLAANRSIGAAWQGGDGFSSGISPANWTVQQMSQGQMTVVGTNGHVSFLVPISTTAEQNAYIIWQGTPTAAEDWTVDIAGHNSAAYSVQGSSALQFAVVRTDHAGPGNLEGYVVSKAQGSSGQGFGATQWINGNYISRTTAATTSVLFGLRLVYHSASQQIEAWYDPSASGSGWAKLDTISLPEFSPSMTASNTFTFAILSDTYYGPVSEGEIWADNFRAMPTPPPLLVADAQRSAGAEVLNLTWTNNGSMRLLESAGALTGGWSTVSTRWTTNAGWVSTSVTNSSPAQFYRLRAN